MNPWFEGLLLIQPFFSACLLSKKMWIQSGTYHPSEKNFAFPGILDVYIYIYICGCVQFRGVFFFPMGSRMRRCVSKQ